MSQSLESWSKFLDDVKQVAADMVAARPVQSPDDEALIVRNCARMMRQALDWEMENAEPLLPKLNCWEVLTMTGAPLGPNLDSPYSLIRLDPGARYRVSGDTEGLLDVNISLRAGFPPENFEVFGDIGYADMKVENGEWELFLGPEPMPGIDHFHPFPPGKHDCLHIFMRLYWADWTHATRPRVEIECLDPAPQKSPPFTADVLTKQLSATSRYLALRAPFQHDWFEGFLAQDQEPRNVPGGNRHVAYGAERYSLAPDEALLVEFDKPKARFWNLQIYDGLVYDSLDWMRNITIRNHLQSYVTPDDRVQMVVAHDDPGVENWLDTGGMPAGIAFFRWIWFEDRPRVSMRVVKLADVRGLLHAATPAFTPEQRAQDLRIRRRKLGHHFFW